MESTRAIRKVLVANRGEIAVRVIRACRTAGLRSVAVYSDADREARHVAMADEAVGIGPAPARESYLSFDRILSAARETSADAIHPGFGFLSENGRFAQAVEDAGLVWIGPRPSSIHAMGLKVESRELMRKAGVPVVPGTHDLDDRAEVLRVGFPCVVKASAGGGGKGMRVVHEPSELSRAIEACRREAGSAFGVDTVYLERYLERPRHVEVQVFGDLWGRVVAIGERDCSLQRRHQKVIEESPSPAVSAELRAKLCEAAILAARAVDYVNAGTVEFLLAPSHEFFFLEMNTRLQVEHAVTEEAFGIDLVMLQLRIASGEPLPERLAEVPIAHALEARIYAEDAENGFLPQTGRVLRYREPSGPGIRVDSGLVEGSEVSVHYDPMLAKARGRALGDGGLGRCDQHRIPASGPGDVRVPPGRGRYGPSGESLDSRSRAARGRGLRRRRRLFSRSSKGAEERGPSGFRGRAGSLLGALSDLSNRMTKLTLAVVGTAHTREIPDVVPNADARAIAARDGSGSVVWVFHRGETYRLERVAARPGALPEAEHDLRAPMPGRIIRLGVAEGDEVEKGAPLLVLSAMKMEHEIRAPRKGVVTRLPVSVGDMVALGDALVELS